MTEPHFRDAYECGVVHVRSGRRGNFNFASNEYCLPVMGLIFFAVRTAVFLLVRDQVEATLPKRGARGDLTKADFSQMAASKTSELSVSCRKMAVRVCVLHRAQPLRVGEVHAAELGLPLIPPR